jgi:hypothetical protein
VSQMASRIASADRPEGGRRFVQDHSRGRGGRFAVTFVIQGCPEVARAGTSLPHVAVPAAPDRLRVRLPYRELSRRRMHSWSRSAHAGLDRGGHEVQIATNAVVPRRRHFIGS